MALLRVCGHVGSPGCQVGTRSLLAAAVTRKRSHSLPSSGAARRAGSRAADGAVLGRPLPLALALAPRPDRPSRGPHIRPACRVGSGGGSAAGLRRGTAAFVTGPQTPPQKSHALALPTGIGETRPVPGSPPRQRARGCLGSTGASRTPGGAGGNSHPHPHSRSLLVGAPSADCPNHVDCREHGHSSSEEKQLGILLEGLLHGVCRRGHDSDN